jgi:serine/threonine protein kinase/tetratricopeptide (TPR) repeat protein
VGFVSPGVRPLTFGPYVAEAAIGSGGMGVVYRARHTATGARVALKTIRVRSPELLASFRREVHVLAGLRYPGIVRILDQGQTNGTPWYAMDLVEGRTLSQVLRGMQAPVDLAPHAVPQEARGTAPALPDEQIERRPTALPPRNPLPLGDLLRLFRRICRALAFLHAHGIVHRDLKPDNILIQPDGAPVLVDFGIVAQFGGGAGREVLDLASGATGTLAYMAPEQRLGRFVDARADLFSLGCILYECVAGALPFGLTGLYALSLDPPLPPSARAQGIPPAIDSLIMRLLARHPHDRLGYADDVEMALEQIEVGGVPSSSPKHRTAYLYRSDFAGRHDVLPRLERALDEAMTGHGAKMLITGESGVGKTRLVMELAARAVEKDMAVITGECPPVGTGGRDGGALGAPLHPLRGLLVAVADTCRLGGAAITERLLAGRARALAPYEPALGDLPGLSDKGELEVLPPDAARARLLTSLKGLLFDFARERPLLLVLDDLQWADDLSLEFVASLTAAECAGAPIAIVGTSRAEEMGERLQAWAEEAGAVHEHLGRFDRDAVEQMVAGMLALRVPPAELVDFVLGESDGNPFFIAEYLRAAIGEGLLDRDAAGHWTLRAAEAGEGLEKRVPLPPTITALIERRLEGLDGVAVDAVHAAAVLGRGFDVELVARTSDMRVAAVLDAYSTLRQRQILEEDGSGITRFVHDRLREIAYAKIDGARIPALHRRAAAAIEERHEGRDLDAQLGALGYHHAKAGAPDRAAGYFERAGDHARMNYANRDAVRFYRLALEQVGEGAGDRREHGGEPGEVRCRLHEALGDLLLLAGEAEAARAAFDTALEGTPGAENVARARRRRKLARTWERQHRHAEALAVYATAEEELGEAAVGEERKTGESGEGSATAEYWHERVQIQVDKAWDLYWLAKVEELAALVEKVRPLVEKHGLAAQRAQFFQALVHMNLRRDRYAIADDTIVYARASLSAAEQAGDVRELAIARFFLAFPLMFRGFEEEAEPLFLAALEGSEHVGDAALQARFLSYYAILHRRLGRVHEVRAAADRAQAIAQKGGMFDYVGASHAQLCWAAWCDGRQQEAGTHAAEAFAAWRKLPPQYPYPFEWFARMPLAAQLADSGRMDDALEHWEYLLQKGQQELPSAIREAIDLALTARRSSASPEDTRGALHRITKVARDLRYL